MRPRSGKPKLSAPRDRMLVRLSVRDQRLTGTQLKREWEEITTVSTSARTVRRRLDDTGMYGKVARKKATVNRTALEYCLNWEKIGLLVIFTR